LAEVLGGSSKPSLDRLAAYCAINPEVLDHFGGRNLPPYIKVIK
jgi:hypothetical protein